MRIQITTPTWYGPRTGTAREAFGRGRYHVTLDEEPFSHREDVVDVHSTADLVAGLAREGWEPSRPAELEWDTYRVFSRRPRELLFYANELEFVR